MKREEIVIGKKVIYYSILGIESTAKEVEIVSEPWDCCGSVICKVTGVTGGVNIENLAEI